MLPLFNSPVKASQTVTWEISASIDDVCRRLHGDQYSTAWTSLVAGFYSASYYKGGCGMRFRNITIPTYSIIESAKLTFTCSLTQIGTNVNTKIRGHDVNNSVQFTDKTDFDNRWTNESTTNIVLWDNIGIWTLNNEYDSPDIKTVIQEIVNRDGWINGNNLTLFWDDFDDRSSHLSSCERRGWTFDSGNVR